MSELKCPFCQKELHSASINGEWLECWNCSYNEPSGHKLPQIIFMGTKELWQTLIDTKKKLDVCEECCREWETDYHLEFEKSIRLENQLKDKKKKLKDTKKKLDRAKWWLKEIVENHRYTPISTAEKALKELRQKEEK